MKKILFMGDSITDAMRDRESETYKGSGYATMVAGELGCKEPYAYEFLNRGISGNRIVDLHARIRKDMRPSISLIMDAMDHATTAADPTTHTRTRRLKTPKRLDC
jgi:hypothetical protein